jgi:mRNA interferase MazF
VRSAPDRGDFVWLSFDPQAGHEQAGMRPALVLSPVKYNKRIGLALVCPITSQGKGYPFEVEIPAGSSIHGFVLADQLKSLDWNARDIRPAGRAPASVVTDTIGKFSTLLQ